MNRPQLFSFGGSREHTGSGVPVGAAGSFPVGRAVPARQISAIGALRTWNNLTTHVVILLSLVFWDCAGPRIAYASWPQKPKEPVVAAASDDAALTLSNVKLPAGWSRQLVAAEPLIANPVAFSIDDNGRIFVCETFRQENAITDNRSHDENWTDHDLAAKTVADRIAYLHELLPDHGKSYTEQDDRIRLLVDRDGDGAIDSATVFADHFNAMEDGTGAGVLPVGDDVWYTCIPHLWRLTDRDGDGRAEQRTSLYRGFGVHVAFRGHDMHGLIRGPDGRIYWSIGDRGYHVETSDGRVLANPDSGAVFRCEPDGSHLEVFATGLRNPQELAFNQYGDLFTGDNNSDSGDRARLVYVVPEGDSGWRMAYQYLPDRGPFNQENIWHPYSKEQPAYVVPPVANIGDGPSGIAFYPGTGVASGLENHFVMCDFRGSSAVSGIRGFSLERDGAFYKLVDSKQPVWQVLATDVAFGPDGYLYLCDWVDGWEGMGKGRMYRVGDPKVVSSELVAQVRLLLAAKFDSKTEQDLVELLAHPDQRIRLKAQFALVDRQAASTLRRVLVTSDQQLQRLHAFWGLQQLGRKGIGVDELATLLPTLGEDPDLEIRRAAALTIRELNLKNQSELLMRLFKDPEPRVVAAAALSSRDYVASNLDFFLSLRDVVQVNDDKDPIVRHCAIVAMSACPPSFMCGQHIDGYSNAVRRAATVALRRQRDHLRFSDYEYLFLGDEDVSVVEEAARAIYEVGFEYSYPDLAKIAGEFPNSNTITRRGMATCLRLGHAHQAETLANIATTEKHSVAHRVEALSLLALWPTGVNRDPVTGMWRPIPPKPIDAARDAFSPVAEELMTSSDRRIQLQSISTAVKLQIPQLAELLIKLFDDVSQSDEIRAAALDSLKDVDVQRFCRLAKTAIADAKLPIRLAALRRLVEVDANQAMGSLATAAESSETRERQTALQLIEQQNNVAAAGLIDSQLAKLNAGEVPADSRLDLVLAAEKLSSASDSIRKRLTQYLDSFPADDKLAKFRDTEIGGDAQRGRQIFFERTNLSCLRCHHIGKDGGEVGPDLSDVGLRRDRHYLVESIVDPNRAITEKFGTVIVETADGKSLTGIVLSEDESALHLINAEGQKFDVAKDSIDDRRDGKSAMPENLIESLSAYDVRDLVEFLADQKAKPNAAIRSGETP